MLVYVYLCCITRYSFMRYIDSIVLYRRRHLQRATINNIYRRYRGEIYRTQKNTLNQPSIFENRKKIYVPRFEKKKCKTEIYSSPRIRFEKKGMIIQRAVRCRTLPHVCVCPWSRDVRGRVCTRKKACMKSGGVRVCVEVSWRWSRGTAPAVAAVR